MFPGWLDSQVAELEDKDGEQAIDHIVSHSGSRENALFEVLWKFRDKMWVPSSEIAALPAVAAYLELQGVEWLVNLAIRTGKIKYGFSSPKLCAIGKLGKLVKLGKKFTLGLIRGHNGKLQ